MKNANPDIHDIAAIDTIVPVAQLRGIIEHLERSTRVDFSACVNHSELMNWAEVARRIVAELRHSGSLRATTEDWDRRESALDRATTLLIKVQSGETRRAPNPPQLRIVR